AEHDVFDGGFHLALLPLAFPAHGYEEIERESRDFQGDNEGDDIDATHEHGEPGHAQGHEEEVFGLNVLADVLEVAAEEEDEREAATEDQLQDLGELVHAVGAAEEGCVLSQAEQA